MAAAAAAAVVSASAFVKCAGSSEFAGGSRGRADAVRCTRGRGSVTGGLELRDLPLSRKLNDDRGAATLSLLPSVSAPASAAWEG